MSEGSAVGFLWSASGVRVRKCHRCRMIGQITCVTAASVFQTIFAELLSILDWMCDSTTMRPSIRMQKDFEVATRVVAQKSRAKLHQKVLQAVPKPSPIISHFQYQLFADCKQIAVVSSCFWQIVRSPLLVAISPPQFSRNFHRPAWFRLAAGCRRSLVSNLKFSEIAHVQGRTSI